MSERLIRENIATSIFRKSDKNRSNLKYVKEDFIGLTTLGSLFKKHENTILATVDASVNKNFNLIKPEIQEKLNKDNLIKISFSEVDDGNFQTDIKLVKNDVTESECDIMIKVTIEGECLTMAAEKSENAIFDSSEITNLVNSYNEIDVTLSNFIDFVDKFNRFISDLVYLYLRFLNVYNIQDNNLELRYKKEMIDNFLDYLVDEFQREILRSPINDEYSDFFVNKDKFIISFKAYSEDKIDYLMFDYIYSPEDEKFVQTNVISSKASLVSKIKNLFTDNILDFITAVRDDLAKILENSKVSDNIPVIQESNIIVILKAVNKETGIITLELNGVTYNYKLKDATKEIDKVEEEIKKILSGNADDIMIYITNNLEQFADAIQEDANADMKDDAKKKDKEGNEQEKNDYAEKKMKKEEKEMTDKEKKDQEKQDEKDKEELEKSKTENKNKMKKEDVDDKIEKKEKEIEKIENSDAPKDEKKDDIKDLKDEIKELEAEKKESRKENRIVKAIKEGLGDPDSDESHIVRSMDNKYNKMDAKVADAVKGNSEAAAKVESKMPRRFKREDIDIVDNDKIIPERILDTEEQDLQGFEDEYTNQYEDDTNNITTEFEDGAPAVSGATTPSDVGAFVPDDMGIQTAAPIGEDEIVNYSRDIPMEEPVEESDVVYNAEKPEGFEYNLMSKLDDVFSEPVVYSSENEIDDNDEEIVYVGDDFDQNDEVIDSLDQIPVEEVIKFIIKKYKEEKNQKSVFTSDFVNDLGIVKEDKIIKSGEYKLIYNKENSAVTLLRKAKVFKEERKTIKEDNRSTEDMRSWRKKHKNYYQSGYAFPAYSDGIQSELVTENVKSSIKNYLKEDKIICEIGDIGIVERDIFEEAINNKDLKVTYLENVKVPNTGDKFSVAILDDIDVLVTRK